MPFDEVVAECLEAIERGATVEACLAQYPNHAAELESLLRVALLLRSAPPPQLSTAAFARGRAAVAAQARYHQRLRTAMLPAAGNHAVPSPQYLNGSTPRRSLPAARPPHPVQRSLATLTRWSSVLVSLVVLLACITATRSVLYSVPGEPLYPLKAMSERVEGVLMTAAGHQARWHIRQVERRLYELDALARQGLAAPTLTDTIEAEVAAAVAASASLPDEERATLFQGWLADLRALQPHDPSTTTVVTLGRVIQTVEAAADAPPAPTVLELTTTPPAPTDTVTSTPTTPAPTAATITPKAARGTITAPGGLVELPTVTPSGFLLPSPTLVWPTFTATAPPPTETPTAVPPTNTPFVAPSAGNDEDEEEPEPPTATPTILPPTPTATATASLTATATMTQTLATATPTVTQTITPVVTITATPVVTVTLTPSPTVSSTPGDGTPTITPTATPTPGESPLPTASLSTETPTPTPSATESATPTETLTETPTPTNTPIEGNDEEDETATPTLTQEEADPSPTATPTSIDEDNEDD
jgi:hypothetical protein